MGVIKKIIVHCSMSRWGNVNVVRGWHTDPKHPGGPYKDIGYQFVILNGHIGPDAFFDSLDGSIECGRPMNSDKVLDGEEVGAHVLGMNSEAVGVCLIGNGVEDFTMSQISALQKLLRDLLHLFDLKSDAVLGHYETPTGKAQGKTCPNMDMAAVRSLLRGRGL